MRKVATDVAPPSLDDEVPAVDELLNRGSFVERLDKAREQREKVLALRAERAEPDLGFAVLGKPWEKPLPSATDESGARRQRLDRAEAAEAVKAIKDYMFAKNDAEPAVAALEPPDLTVSAAPATEIAPIEARGGLGVPRILAGFALGLALGLGLTWLTGRLPAAPEPANSGEAGVLPVATAAVSAKNDATAAEQATLVPQPPAVNATAASTTVPGSADDPALDAAPLAGEVEGLVGQAAPFALASAAEQSDRPLQAPAALPEQPAHTGPAPALAAQETPDETGLAETGQAQAPVQYGTAAPIMLASAAENSDLALEPQPLPAAFTPVDDVLTDPESPPDNGAENPVVPGAISVHVLAAASAADHDLTSVAATLGASGYDVTETATVSFTISKSHVRYYHAQDADAAGALAQKVGVAARDFTSFTPPPPVGTVEVWLAGAGPETPPAPKKKKKQKKSAAPPAPPPSEEQQLQALRDRLLLQLQNTGNP